MDESREVVANDAATENPYSHYRGGTIVQIRLERDLTRPLVELAALERRPISSLCNLIIRDFLLPPKNGK
jgi:hypothetical protein